MKPLFRAEVRVLLVDDSPEQRQLVSLQLSELTEPRFLVTEVYRLSDALQVLEQEKVDVVLLDLFLPDSHGLETVTALRKRFSGLPIIVITETADEKLAIRALREGAEDYLVKIDATSQVLKRVILHGMERRRVAEAMASNRERLVEGQKLEALGRLAGGIAHDFNNLLVSIIGYSEILVEDLADSELRADADEINKAGHRAAELTKQILAFSRRDQANNEALQANDIVDDMRKMLTRLMPRSMELEIHLSQELPRILVDRGQFEQIIISLVTNARDAMEGRGRIDIRTEFVELSPGDPHLKVVEKPGSYICLRISDTGPGLPEKVLAGISEPFFTASSKDKGTSLGLSTVYGIVQTAQGGIAVDSAEGLGTTFYLYFPAVESNFELQDELELGDFSAKTMESVLILEDNDSLKDLMQRILTRAGYQVSTSTNPEQAQDLLASVDLLILAKNIQGLNGEALAGNFLQKNPDLRLLLLISHSGEAGGVLTPYPTLTKPFTPRRLLSRVREVLDAPPPIGDSPFDFIASDFPSTESNATVKESSNQPGDCEQHLRELENTISHDLQEPVRMINEYLDLLAQNELETLEQDSREFLLFAQEGARRLQKMLRGIREISRLRREVIEEHKADTRQAFRQLQERFRLHPGSLSWKGPFPELPMKIEHLYNFLGELVSNGFKFQNLEQAEVRIVVELVEEGTILRVEDNGVGFPDGDRERCLALFGRMHSRDEYDGTGLGLAYCRAIANKYQGTLTIESEKQSGSKVSFFLPWRKSGSRVSTSELAEES